MNKFVQKILSVADFDLRHSKHFDFDNNMVHRFTLELNNFIFWSFLMLCIIYFSGVWLFDSDIYTYVHTKLIPTQYHGHLKNDPLQVYFFASSILVLLLALPSAIFFYVRYGGGVQRVDFVTRIYFNVFFTNVCAFFMNVFAVGMFLFIGYLLGFKWFVDFGLNKIPGAFLFQIYILLKCLSFAGISSSSIFQLLLPYNLHPSHLRQKNNIQE